MTKHTVNCKSLLITKHGFLANFGISLHKFPVNENQHILQAAGLTKPFSLQTYISCPHDKLLLSSLSTPGFFPYCPISFEEICQSVRSLRPLPFCQLQEQALSSKGTRYVMGKSQPFGTSALVKSQESSQNVFPVFAGI